MGILVCGALFFGIRLIVTAPGNMFTVYDYSNCWVPPLPHPCEPVAFRTGTLNVVFSVWCGMMLIGVAAWLVWELWGAVAPKPITDEFLQLLEHSFGRSWRRP